MLANWRVGRASDCLSTPRGEPSLSFDPNNNKQEEKYTFVFFLPYLLIQTINVQKQWPTSPTSKYHCNIGLTLFSPHPSILWPGNASSTFPGTLPSFSPGTLPPFSQVRFLLFPRFASSFFPGTRSPLTPTPFHFQQTSESQQTTFSKEIAFSRNHSEIFLISQ